MNGPKTLPKRSDLVDYNYAVAGHAGTLCTAEGELFIKPCTQAEIDFYQSAQEEHPDFADLMPLFLGTLSLSDASNVEQIRAQLPLDQDAKDAGLELMLQPQTPVILDNDTWVPKGSASITTDRAIVLENASYGYKKPNILDVKLGQRLWADDAPKQKRARFEQIRAETTHEKYGFRIAGMRVYKGSPDAAELDEEGYKVYDKDYGRFQVNDYNVVDAFRQFIFNECAGIDEEVGRAVAQAFKADLERVREVLEKERSRMYSSSLLFVFEGDGDALRAAIDEASASAAESEQGRGEDSGRSTYRVDSGIALDDDGELIPVPGDEKSELVLAAADGDRSELVASPAGDDLDDDDDDEESSMPRIYSLKLIDFAHAKWVPHEKTPDENSLVGVRSLIQIFDELSK